MCTYCRRTCEFMFETMKVPALFLSKDAVLSCYSTGRTSGVCVDFGHSGCNITPVTDGYVDPKGLNRSIVGGQCLTAYTKHVMQKLLFPAGSDPSDATVGVAKFRYKHYAAWAARGVTPSPSVHAYLNLELYRNLRENVCSRIMGTEDLAGQSVFSFDSATPSAALSSLQNVPPSSYELPDGQIVSVGVERFMVPELICDPSPVLGDAAPAAAVLNDVDVDALGCNPVTQSGLPFSKEAIPYQIIDSILKSDVENINTLFGNLIISGGASNLEGLSERLKFEIEKSLANRTHHLMATIPPNMRIRHYTPAAKEANISAWLGGSILGSLSSFHDTWISKAEYDERGSSIVDKKCP